MGRVPVGGAPAPDPGSPDTGKPAGAPRFRYTLVQRSGEVVAPYETDRPLRTGNVLVPREQGDTWRVVSVLGTMATITRLSR
jgi:hypothetical protein